MSSSFVLPMIAGITLARIGTDKTASETSNLFYSNAFGVIALIALTPIIAIQILGVIQNIRIARARYVMRRHVYSASDAQIIHFERK